YVYKQLYVYWQLFTGCPVAGSNLEWMRQRTVNWAWIPAFAGMTTRKRVLSVGKQTAHQRQHSSSEVIPAKAGIHYGYRPDMLAAAAPLCRVN
ncbi:MAG: hypothetical protein KDE28_06895, partial [Anaerolineales bacterium]|nr:hypothetical protein [Anaerolineales bacterium]